MNLRRAFRGACLAAGVLALAGAGPASAKGQKRKTIQPLTQYLVSGKGASADELARAGYDLIEAQSKRYRGRFAIVATPAQAARLVKKGAQVKALGGVSRAAQAGAANPLTQPTHGYDVFRPWSLTPAACPTTCATPPENLKTFYHRLATEHRDIVKEVVLGRSVLGQPIMAYKVTEGARKERDGSRPAVLYNAVQHAREWIAAEVNRRLFEHVVTRADSDDAIAKLVEERELWFVPIVNPDGYDYTFTQPATRLWRKNLHDVDGDGQITNRDGVDPNRNWPSHWNYDLEGASDDPTTEVYHGSGPASEPEVQAVRGLEQRIRPKFQIDFHSFARLILYPFGFQVETPATDWPLLSALAGDDDRPAVAGFDPDVSAELYTTNGDITDDALSSFGTQAFTVELDGGDEAKKAGGTDGSDPAYTPNGFIFQDVEADVQAEFQKNLAFALDLAKSAAKPDEPKSHLGNTAPDLVPTTFDVSYGDPQTVEVNAKRRVGAVRVLWQVNGGPTRSATTTEYNGGKRYGAPGVYYHRLRGVVTGTSPGDTVKVWFEGRRKGSRSTPFTYTAKQESANKVLLLAAEDYTGRSGASGHGLPYAGPLYLDTYKQALQDAGIGYDVYDVDASGRKAASHLGVLSHYDTVVWYTGEDLYTREPTQPGGTGVSKLLDDEILAARDYMNEGGGLLVTGKFALQGAWDQFLFNPLGAPPAPFCRTNQTQGNGDADDPVGQSFNCVGASNDFQQYWLGAWLPITAAHDTAEAAALPFAEAPALGSEAFGLNGADSAANQDNVSTMLTTSSILPKATYPQFAGEPAIKIDRPPAYDPPTGARYAWTQQAHQAYKRLTQTVDLTGKSTGSLAFKLSYDTESDFDYVFVEAHVPGSDSWTTLPDANQHTSDDTGAGCPDTNPFWLNLHPFLRHYITRGTNDKGELVCTPTGTTGTWNAATGNSAGFQDWNVDLTPYQGGPVEVSITYVTDPATQGLGAFLDDVTVSADGAPVNSTSFEGGLAPWTAGGPPEGSPGNVNNWDSVTSRGFVDAPGIATDHSLFWGFGLEGVTDAAKRAQLVKDAVTYLSAK